MPLKTVTVESGAFSKNDLDLDLVTDFLIDLGAFSVSVEDADRGTASESPIFREPRTIDGGIETLNDAELWNNLSEKYWKNVVIKAIFPEETDVEAVVMEIGSAFNLATPPRFESVPVENEDWVVKVQNSFQPIKVGRTWVTFPWSDMAGLIQDNEYSLLLQPGMAFGTGEHTTTKLIVQWLQHQLLDPSGNPNPETKSIKLLDYGAGSGILALFAIKMGIKSAIGVEIDSDALQTAQVNAENNGVSNEQCRWYLPKDDPSLDQQFDITVANILAEPLRILAPLLAKKTKIGGRIALSGLLVSQAAGLSDIYTVQGFDMNQADTENGWCLLTGIRRR